MSPLPSRVLHVLGRVVRTVLLGLAGLLVFVVALVASVLLQLNLPGARRLAVRELNGVLAGQFVGKVTLTRLGHLGIFGVGGVDAQVIAADGTQVILARGVSASISPVAIIKSALFGKSDILIGVDRITIDAVEADVDSLPDASLKLVHAFDSPTPPTPAKPGARGIAIALSDVRLTHAWVHGVIAGVPPIDADVDDLRAAFLSSSDTTKLDVARLALNARGLPMGLHPFVLAEAHLAIPAAPAAPMTVRGAIAATIGDVALTAHMAMDGDAIDAVLDVPKVSASNLRASVVGAPVYEDVAAHGEAHGTLEKLTTTLHADVGAGTVDVDGIVHVTGALGGDLTVDARHIDARAFAEDGPATDVGLHAHAVAETKADESLVGHVALEIPVGTAAGQMVPRTTLQVDVEQHARRENGAPLLTGHVEGIVDEPGAPVAITADARSTNGVSDVTVAAKADAPRLEDVKRLGEVGSGNVQVAITARAHLAAALSFDAEVKARGRGIVSHGARVAEVDVVGTASGTPASPVVKVRALAGGVAVSQYRFSRLEVEAAGGLADLRVAGAGVGAKSPDVTFATNVALAPALALRETHVAINRGTDKLRVVADTVKMDGDGVTVSGVEVSGAGEPLTASAHSAPGVLVVKARTRGLDVAKLAYLAGQDAKVAGTVALDVDVDARRDRARGEVHVDLTNGSVASVRDADAHLNLTLDGRHVAGALRAAVGDAGTFDVHDLDLHVGGGGALDVKAWRAAWGKVGITANLDMGRVAAILPAGSLGLTDLAGRVTLDGDIARDSLEDKTPEVRLSLVTSGLSATGQSTAPLRIPGGPVMVGPATWTVTGLDLRGDLMIDGADSAGELALRVVDEKGALVSLDVKTDPLPFAEVLGGKSDVTAELEALPVSIRLDVPQREVSQLPLIVRPDGVHGGASVALTMSGTAMKPEVDLAVRTKGLTIAAAPTTPMDASVDAKYDGALATVSAKVLSNAASLLDASAEVHADAKEALAVGAAAKWTGSAKAALAKFPLQAISLNGHAPVKGFVSGDVAVTGLHEHAAAQANLAFDGLQLGKAKFRKGDVHATVGDDGLDAKARFETADGFFDANAKMGMKWGADVAPSPNGTGVQATLSAKHFPAAAAGPFAPGSIGELAGWIDADAKLALLPGQKPQMSGSVALTDAVVEAPGIGETFHGIKAKVTLTDQGIVKLEDVEAHGLSGVLTAQGSAHLDGTTLLGADLSLNIPKGSGIPLDIQGTNLGSAYGNVAIKATGAPDGSSIKVAVTVPSFRVDLPDASLPRAPQGLGPADGVHMGVYRNPDRFIVLAPDGAPVTLVATRNAAVASLPASGGVTPKSPPSPGQAEAAKTDAPGTSLDVAVKLGNVEIVRGQQLVINLDGNLDAKVGAATVVRGQIHVKDGKLQVQGKEFTIDKGTVSFVGDDPSNPEVNLTAGWNAPDGTRVLADYIGPVKTGKVSLRSEPPRPKNEIVALILFGSADGSSSTPYASKSPSTGTQAGTAVGGLATDGLSKGLDQLTGMDVTAKIDTSDSANPRPEVEVQIAKDISLELSVVLGTPPPGTNPDTSYATIDWRFVRNWSLATTFGDEGSTFADIVWQYRY